MIESLRFEDEDHYEYKILPGFFACCRKIFNPESFIVPFFSRKISAVIFNWEGLALSHLQND